MSTYVPDNCTEAMDYGLWYWAFQFLHSHRMVYRLRRLPLQPRRQSLHLAANCRSVFSTSTVKPHSLSLRVQLRLVDRQLSGVREIMRPNLMYASKLTRNTAAPCYASKRRPQQACAAHALDRNRSLKHAIEHGKKRHIEGRSCNAVAVAGHAQDLDGRMLASSMPRAPAVMVAVFVATDDASARPKTSASASRRRSDASSVRVTPQG